MQNCLFVTSFLIISDFQTSLSIFRCMPVFLSWWLCLRPLWKWKNICQPKDKQKCIWKAYLIVFGRCQLNLIISTIKCIKNNGPGLVVEKAKGNFKNNIENSNVVPHRSTTSTRSCLTSMSRRVSVFSWLYGRSCFKCPYLLLWWLPQQITNHPMLHSTNNDTLSNLPIPLFLHKTRNSIHTNT